MTLSTCYVTAAIHNIQYKKDLIDSEKNVLDENYVFKPTKDILNKYPFSNMKSISGDSFTEKFESGEVVAINGNGRVYKTEIEVLTPKQRSQCDGPDAIRGIFHYYLVNANQSEDSELSSTETCSELSSTETWCEYLTGNVAHICDLFA